MSLCDYPQICTVWAWVQTLGVQPAPRPHIIYTITKIG